MASGFDFDRFCRTVIREAPDAVLFVDRNTDRGNNVRLRREQLQAQVRIEHLWRRDHRRAGRAQATEHKQV